MQVLCSYRNKNPNLHNFMQSSLEYSSDISYSISFSIFSIHFLYIIFYILFIRHIISYHQNILYGKLFLHAQQLLCMLILDQMRSSKICSATNGLCSEKRMLRPMLSQNIHHRTYIEPIRAKEDNKHVQFTSVNFMRLLSKKSFWHFSCDKVKKSNRKIQTG